MNQIIIFLFHWLCYDLFVYLTWIWWCIVIFEHIILSKIDSWRWFTSYLHDFNSKLILIISIVIQWRWLGLCDNLARGLPLDGSTSFAYSMWTLTQRMGASTQIDLELWCSSRDLSTSGTSTVLNCAPSLLNDFNTN